MVAATTAVRRIVVGVDARLKMACSRYGLRHAARRSRDDSRDAGAVLGPGVIPSKNLFVSGESGFAEGERFGGQADDKV